MYNLDHIAKEVGLLDGVQAAPMQKTSSVKDTTYHEIMEYLKNDTLSSFLEKEASAPGDVVKFAREAEERGFSEQEIADMILEKKGYEIPAGDDTPQHRMLLEKAADRIQQLEMKNELVEKQLELVKVAMDLVEAGGSSPFSSYDELTDRVANLIKEDNPELIKVALRLYNGKYPSAGSVSTRPSGGSTAKEIFESSLSQL